MWIHRAAFLSAVFAVIVHAQAPTSRPTRGLTQPAPIAASATRTRYVALVVGNNDYKYVPRLSTALVDAQEVARVLRTQFGFQTEFVPNATREQILGALNKYRNELSPDQALVIYYAGHGYRDKEVDRAYWLPVDAAAQNINWISIDDINTALRGTHARHILVVSDSCYAGALSRDVSPTVLPSGDRARFLENLRQKGPSRMLLASGGDEPVADGGGDGQHSVFATALLRGLQNMEHPQFTVEELFLRVQESVAGRSQQVPQLSPIRNSGHDEGSFIFERSGAPGSAALEPPRQSDVEVAKLDPIPVPLQPPARTQLIDPTPKPVSSTAMKLSHLQANITFQPAGAPSGQLTLTLTPNAGTTYSASVFGTIVVAFVNGTASNEGQKFSFDAIEPGRLPFAVGGAYYAVSGGALRIALTQTNAPGSPTATGSLSGSLSLLGAAVTAARGRISAPQPGTDPAGITLSGQITGTYYATMVPDVPGEPVAVAVPTVTANPAFALPTVPCADGCSSKIGDFNHVAQYTYAHPMYPSLKCDERVFKLPADWPGGPFLHSVVCKGLNPNRANVTLINFRLAATARDHDEDVTILFDGATGSGSIPSTRTERLRQGPWRVKIFGGGEVVESMTIEVKPSGN